MVIFIGGHVWECAIDKGFLSYCPPGERGGGGGGTVQTTEA